MKKIILISLFVVLSTLLYMFIFKVSLFGTNEEVIVEPKADSAFCGGIAAIPCSFGYECKLDGAYPDAGGSCVKLIK